jgi:hypothetical protein
MYSQFPCCRNAVVESESTRSKAGVPVCLPLGHLKGAVVVGAWQIILESEALLWLVVGPLAGFGALDAVSSAACGVVCDLWWVTACAITYCLS